MSKPHSRRAYSYIRFSTVQQADGGSLKRQTELSQAYCQRKGMNLDETLTLRDLGVSAFRGDNVRDGALAGFLEACRTGRVPKGSALIVESLDRLSRDQIRPALQLFLALQDHGITIVTLQPEREYPPEATDALALIEPLIVFARAHEESAIKSHRRRDGWKQARDKARQGGGPIMKTCPAWLEVTEEGYRIKEEAAATVRLIFALAIKDGVEHIAKKLNQDGIPPIGTGSRWVKPYVYRILTNPAAMGTHQPNRQEGKHVVPDGEPIPGHYPAIVSEEEWHRAQAAIESRAGGFKKGAKASPAAGRKSEQETNLFTGMAFCASTGEKLNLVYALGRKTEGKRKRYLYLVSSRDSGTHTGIRVDYHVFENAILSLLRELKPADLAAEGKPKNGRHAEMAQLSGRLLDIDGKLERAKQRARTTEDFDAFLDLIQDLQTERKQASARLAELQREEEAHTPADLGEAQTLIGLLAKTPADKLPELRGRLKARLRVLISELWVLPVSPRGNDKVIAVQIFFRSGQRRDYIIIHLPGRSYGAFRKESRCWVCSLADVAALGNLDLRKVADAQKLAAALSAVNPADLAGQQ